MTYGLGTRLVIAIGFLFALVLSGCVQQSKASRCDDMVNVAQKDECVEYMAVWYQDPYLCYEVQDYKKRESCLNRAITPRESRILQAQREFERSRIETVVEGTKVDTKIIDVAPQTDERVKQCMQEERLSIDACTHKIAIESSDILMCEKIGSDSYKRPCISNIAIVKKNQEDCNLLARADDRQLCVFYASG